MLAIGKSVVVTGRLVVETGKIDFAMVVVAPRSRTTEVVMVLVGLLAASCACHL